MRFIEALNRGLFTLAAIATLVMAALGLGIVVLRYGFATGWIAGQESLLYLHALVFLVAAATTLSDEGHVRVDIFYGRWSARRQALVDLGGSLLLLLPFALFIAGVSLDYVADAWQRRETSTEAGGLGIVYLLKSLMLVFAVQMLLQALVQARRAWQTMRAA